MALAAFFRYFTSLDLPMKVIEDSDGRKVEAHRRPLGVIGAIMPWNFPLILMAFKVPAALLAGNTVVLKPAPTTPLATLRLAELIKDIVPPGVLNVITDANDLGGALTKHPDVRKISFTGSTATGKKVMASAADALKRITLELGGNDAGHRARRRRSQDRRAEDLRRRLPEQRPGLHRHQAGLCARVDL